MTETLSLRVVTFNAWALPVSIPSQQKRRRMRRLPQALAALDADVIVLQEMFDVRARRRVLQELCPPYETTPDAMHSRCILRLVRIDETGGLLVLSRLPISGSCFIRHPHDVGSKPDERIGHKGGMILHLDTPLGRVTVLALHLYAGTKRKHAHVRCAQLAPLLEAVKAEANGSPVVLAGDVNTSPTVGYPEPAGPENPLTPEYATLVEAGFTDPQPPNPTPARRTATWVPSRNRYAALPYQETKTDARYDYVLTRSGVAHAWSVKDARTVLDEPGAHLSDHVGVQVELELSRQDP
jgi:endonuclease/exonuclease/phosphatase family metal-dependent hydrolase